MAVATSAAIAVNSSDVLSQNPPSPADSLVREEYSQNNNVSEKKVEARIQKKVIPTLKDLKNDLKSLSQLIHEAPRKSKSTTPKRKQS